MALEEYSLHLVQKKIHSRESGSVLERSMISVLDFAIHIRFMRRIFRSQAAHPPTKC